MYENTGVGTWFPDRVTAIRGVAYLLCSLQRLTGLTGLDFVSDPQRTAMKVIFSLTTLTLVAFAICVTHGNLWMPNGKPMTLVTRASPSPSPSPKLTKLKRARVRMPKPPSASQTLAAPSVTEFCWFPWKAPWRGDCELASREPGGVKGPEFCFRSDGTGTFKGRARTTHNDDTYIVRFELLDRTGKLLFRLPAKTGPSGGPTYWTKHLDNPGVWYDWQVDFSFPAQHLYQIYYVNGDCLVTAL